MNNHNLTTIGDVISRFLDENKLGTKVTEQRIKKQWPLLMGEMIANHTKNISYKKYILYISIDNSVLRNELYYGRDKIKDLINKHFAKEYVIDVIIQ